MDRSQRITHMRRVASSAKDYRTSYDFPLDVFAVAVGLMFLVSVSANLEKIEFAGEAPSQKVYSSQWNCDSILYYTILYPWATKASKAWTVIIGILMCCSACVAVLRSLGYLPNKKKLGIMYLMAAIIVLSITILGSLTLADDLSKEEGVNKTAEYRSTLPKPIKRGKRASKKLLLDYDDERQLELVTAGVLLADGYGVYPCINWKHRVPLCTILTLLYMLSCLNAFCGSTSDPIGFNNEIDAVASSIATANRNSAPNKPPPRASADSDVRSTAAAATIGPKPKRTDRPSAFNMHAA